MIPTLAEALHSYNQKHHPDNLIEWDFEQVRVEEADNKSELRWTCRIEYLGANYSTSELHTNRKSAREEITYKILTKLAPVKFPPLINLLKYMIVIIINNYLSMFTMIIWLKGPLKKKKYLN